MRYRYSWGPRWSDIAAKTGLPVLYRKGEECELVARGAMNSAMVRFDDGEIAVVSRNALRKVVEA